jgi:hypothetical protein
MAVRRTASLRLPDYFDLAWHAARQRLMQVVLLKLTFPGAQRLLVQ